MKSACLVVLATLLLVVSGVAARSQATQQTGDQPKTDLKTSKKDTKPKKSDAAAQTPPAAAAASTAPGETPAAAPPAAAPASTASTSGPAAKPATVQQPRPANSGGMVWVNTESGIYHKPGSRYYGKTKRGKYMTEADAIKAGYHAAKKE